MGVYELEIFLTLVVFAALLFLLYRMQTKYVKYATRVFTGLGIGILFGFLPARKAARLNPIDALRYD